MITVIKIVSAKNLFILKKEPPLTINIIIRWKNTIRLKITVLANISP